MPLIHDMDPWTGEPIMVWEPPGPYDEEPFQGESHGEPTPERLRDPQEDPGV